MSQHLNYIDLYFLLRKKQLIKMLGIKINYNKIPFADKGIECTQGRK